MRKKVLWNLVEYFLERNRILKEIEEKIVIIAKETGIDPRKIAIVIGNTLVNLDFNKEEEE